jgi:hypothetical protein
MRMLLLLALLPLLSPPGRDVELRYAPAEGTVLERTFDAHARYELTQVELSVNGEAIEVDEIPELTNDFHEHVGVTDELETVDVGSGRPTALIRTFDSLTQTFVVASEEDEATSESSSDLEGRSLRYELEDDEWSIAADDDGDDPEDDLAEWLLEDMDLRAVLPDEAVAVGDEWEIGPELYLSFMWPGGLVGWYSDEEEAPGEADREMNAQTIENLEGGGTVTFEELREEDGVRVAVLRVTLEVETSCGSEAELEGATMTVEVEIERSLEGTILWDVDSHHALSAELAGEGSRLTTRTRTLETEEGELELEEVQLFEGTIGYEATFERH